MEYGVVPKLDVYVSEYSQKFQKVQPSSSSSEIFEGKKSSFVDNKILQAQDGQKVFDVEYNLTNFDFGFNNNSNEFFVRAIRGEFQNQYPTEDMMRLRSYLLEVAEVS